MLSATKQSFRTLQIRTMSTNIKHYDYLVIGGGSGGVASARRAASYGAKTLLAVSYTHLDVYKRQE